MFLANMKLDSFRAELLIVLVVDTICMCMCVYKALNESEEVFGLN